MRLCIFDWDVSLITWKLQNSVWDYEVAAVCKLCYAQYSAVDLATKRGKKFNM
jgi:hypothetical protein